MGTALLCTICRRKRNEDPILAIPCTISDPGTRQVTSAIRWCAHDEPREQVACQLRRRIIL